MILRRQSFGMKRVLFRASQAGRPMSRHSPFRTAVGIKRPDRCAVPGSGRVPPLAHAGAPGSRIRGEHGAAIMGGLAGEGLGALAEGVPPGASVRCRNTGSADARCVRRGAARRSKLATDSTVAGDGVGTSSAARTDAGPERLRAGESSP